MGVSIRVSQFPKIFQISLNRVQSAERAIRFLTRGGAPGAWNAGFSAPSQKKKLVGKEKTEKKGKYEYHNSKGEKKQPGKKKKEI